MSTADWALIVSLCSMAIALASFVWNVWSKFIFPKGKVDVGFAVMTTYSRDGVKGQSAVSITATNLGPNQVTVYCAIARGKRRRLGTKAGILGILNPYRQFPYDLETDGPFSSGLPKKLGVGEQLTLYFPLVKDWFEGDELVCFGVSDTFGRNHWAPRRLTRTVRERVLEEGQTDKELAG